MNPTLRRVLLSTRGVDRTIYGASWGKVASPVLTRTDASVGMVANAGVDMQVVRNDFDNTPLFGGIRDVTDSYGNVFVRIPKCYIRKTDGASLSWQVSLFPWPGFYLPSCFWDFTNNRELPHVDIGKYKASIGAGSRLESKPDVFPLVNTNIVDMRTFARNNNIGGLLGYQQLDVHVVDLLQALFYVMFGTLNSQSIMQGFTTGQYNALHVATATEAGANRIVVANAHANLFRVGQPISIGTFLGGNQIAINRGITAINVVDGANRAIVFDGAAVNIATGNIVYNSAWRNGFSANITARNGSLVSNTDGLRPCVFLGIESLWGDCWQFVDGVNINERQAWVARNAADYTSNVFAAPYEQLSYINHAVDGYVTAMGYDANRPFAALPTAVGGGSTTHYSDFYYQMTGQRVALVGGFWNFGAASGLSFWVLNDSSTFAYLALVGRLVKKPL